MSNISSHIVWIDSVNKWMYIMWIYVVQTCIMYNIVISLYTVMHNLRQFDPRPRMIPYFSHDALRGGRGSMAELQILKNLPKNWDKRWQNRTAWRIENPHFHPPWSSKISKITSTHFQWSMWRHQVDVPTLAGPLAASQPPPTRTEVAPRLMALQKFSRTPFAKRNTMET